LRNASTGPATTADPSEEGPSRKRIKGSQGVPGSAIHTTGAGEEPQPLTVHPSVLSHPVEETERVGKPSLQEHKDDSPEESEEEKEDSGDREEEPPTPLQEDDQEEAPQSSEVGEESILQPAEDPHQFITGGNHWKTIKDPPESEEQGNIQEAILETVVSNLADDDYKKQFLRRATVSLQKLARIFLGTPIDPDALENILLRLVENASHEPVIYRYQIRNVRRLINYDHSNPVQVFTWFVCFVARYQDELNILRVVQDSNGNPRIAIFLPYHAPSYQGLEEHIYLELVPVPQQNHPGEYAQIVGVATETRHLIDHNSIGALPPCPELIEEQEQNQLS